MRNIKLILFIFLIASAPIAGADEFSFLNNLSNDSDNLETCPINTSDDSCGIDGNTSNITNTTSINDAIKNDIQECRTYNVGNCEGVIRALYFYEDGCPNCERIKPFIEEIELKYNNLNITKINAREELELCIQCAICHNVSASVPMIILSNYALVGYTEIKNKFEGLIKTCRDEECPCIIVPNPNITYPVLPNLTQNQSDNYTLTVPEGKICLLLFMSPVCSECHTAESYINKMEEKYPQVSVIKLYINERRNQELMGKYSAKYNITPGTLAVFIGDKYFTDANSVRENLEPEIKKYINKGLKCPQPSTKGIWEEIFENFGVFTIIFAGLIDGINPCAMATLIFFLSYLSIVGRKGKDILLIGIAFTSAVFISYLLIGLGLLEFIMAAQEKIEIISKLIYPAAGLCALIFFYFSVKDYFKASEGKAEDMTLQLPKNVKGIIHAIIRKQVRMKFFVAAAFTTGFLVSLFEFLCTGQVYLPTIIYIMGIPELQSKAIFYLILYNIMFVVPLLAIFLVTYFGTTSKAISGVFAENVPTIKILTAILFLILAVFMFVMSAEMFGIL